MLQNESIFGFSPLSFQATFQSMPSGHTTTAFAVATVLAWFFPKAQTLWLLFAAAIAVSRIMVNAHYLADVFAGAAVGYATVVFLRHHINHNGINHIRHVIFPIDRKV
jgi:undecaprenyl-diphosphatase